MERYRSAPHPSAAPCETTPAALAATTGAPYSHIAYAANATPSVVHSFAHPPYSEMICTAIAALNESNGSSKRAIARYINDMFRGLPPAHSALLTHHLKRLKNNGVLVMDKKSYKLSRSDFLNTNSTYAQPLPLAQIQPRQKANSALAVTSCSTLSIKRGRGRPPKVKPGGQVDGSGVKREPMVLSQAGPIINKRGRGRPPKTGLQIISKPGRARGFPSVLGTNDRVTGIDPLHGNPSMIQPSSVFVPYSTGSDGSIILSGRGCPKEHLFSGTSTSGNGGVAIRPVRRPAQPLGVRRPVGRPKKAQAAAAYRDLKLKLELFQSRVKQAVGILKPHLSNVATCSAAVAVEELEGLVTMDIDAPLKDEPQTPAFQI